MKKVLKKSILLLPLSLIALGAVGCNGKSSGKTKITFWHTMGQGLQTVLDRVIEEFNKAYPDVEIEHAAQGGYTDLEDKIKTAIPAGTTPTMAYCYPDHVAEYMESNACISVADYINDPELGFTAEEGSVDDFIKAYWQEGKEYVQEGIFSVPFQKSTELVFYNKTVFDAEGYTIPQTWEELETLMATMKANDPETIPLGYDSDSNLFITLCEQYGIPYTSLKDGTASADFNNPAAKKMVEKLKSWYDLGYIQTQGTSNGAYTSTLFTEGKLLMTVGSTGGTTYNYTTNFEIGTAQVFKPKAEGHFDFFEGTGTTQTLPMTDHTIMQGPSICFFRRGTKAQKEAAWRFYKYLAKADFSSAFAIKNGYSPVRESSFTSPSMVEYLSKDKTGEAGLIQNTIRMYPELTGRYFVSPAFHGSSTARNQVGAILSNVFVGTKDIATAFAEAIAKVKFAMGS